MSLFKDKLSVRSSRSCKV